MADPAGSYIAQADLVTALSAQTLIELFDDDRDGTADPTSVQFVIDQAEAEVNSYLLRAYPSLTLPVTQSPMSNMLKRATLMFAVPFSFQRHPEYTKTYGENPRGEAMEKRARDMMERLCTGEQMLFDVPAEKKPTTVGGTFTDPGPRIFVDSSGNYTGGDFAFNLTLEFSDEPMP